MLNHLQLDCVTHVLAPLEPTEDDQRIVNDVTAARIGGSSARAIKASGALSVADVGSYPASVQLSLASDQQALHQASWRVHMGTWDEARYPTVPVDLAANPTLVASATAVDLGDVITVTSLPAWVPPGPVYLVAEGSTETITAFGWTRTFNTVPYGAFRVAQDGVEARLDSPDSALTNPIGAGDTVFDVTVPVDAPWITSVDYPGEFPFDVVAGGEQMSVIDIQPPIGDSQEFTVDRGVNGISNSLPADTPISLDIPYTFPIGSGAPVPDNWNTITEDPGGSAAVDVPVAIGDGPPGDTGGADGTFYIDANLWPDADPGPILYGPKVGGTWSSAPGDIVFLRSRVTGLNVAPDDGDGRDGDVYFDLSGPSAYLKAAGTWGTPIDLGGGNAAVIETVNTVATSGTSQTLPDVTTATMNHITLTGNCTITPPTAADGKSLTVTCKQDATGGRTITWSSVRWSGGSAVTQTSTASKADTYVLYCDHASDGWNIIRSAANL